MPVGRRPATEVAVFQCLKGMPARSRSQRGARMVLNLGRPKIAALRLGGRRGVSKRQLPPPDRARGADREPLGSPPARHSAVNRGNDTTPKITR
jgi:hypothetical protein